MNHQQQQISLYIALSIILIAIYYETRYREATYRGALCPIFMINLKDRPERLKHSMEVLETIGIRPDDVSRVAAIDTRQMPISDIKMLLTDEAFAPFLRGHRASDHELTYGAIGCYRSHMKAWRQFVEHTDAPFCIIFEDDITIRPYRGGELFAIIDHLKRQVADGKELRDIYLLGHTDNETNSLPFHFYKTKRFLLFHAYIISRKCAARLLANSEMQKINQQIDSQLADMSERGDLDIVRYKPILFDQRGETTDIQASLALDPAKSAFILSRTTF